MFFRKFDFIFLFYNLFINKLPLMKIIRKVLLIFIIGYFVFSLDFVFAQFNYQDSDDKIVGKLNYNVSLYNLRITDVKVSTSSQWGVIRVTPTSNFKCYLRTTKNRVLKCPNFLNDSLLNLRHIKVYLNGKTKFYGRNEKLSTISDLKLNNIISIKGILRQKDKGIFYIQSSIIVNLSKSTNKKFPFVSTSSLTTIQQKKETENLEQPPNRLLENYKVVLNNIQIIKVYKFNSTFSTTSNDRSVIILAKPNNNFDCFTDEKNNEKLSSCPGEIKKMLLNKEFKIYVENKTKLYFKELNEATITDFAVGDIIDANGLLNVYENNIPELSGDKIVNKSKSLINLKTSRLALIPNEYYSLAESYYQKIGKKFYIAQFSKDGKRVDYAFMFRAREKPTQEYYPGLFSEYSFVVVNGEKQKGYFEVFPDSITFSPNGQKLAYIARDNYGYFLVVNGQEGKRYQEILTDSLNFSPDSENIVCVARNKIGDDKYEYFIVVNGNNEGRKYEEILPNTIMFSDDGKKISYVVKDKNRFFTVFYSLDEKSGGENTYSFFNPSVTSNFYNSNLSREFLSDDQQKQIFNIINSFAYSPDGKKFAYVVEKDGKLWAIVNGERLKGYDLIYSLNFSPDSKKLAYIAEEKGEKFVVVNNKEGQKFDWIYTQPQFTPDSKYLYYGARKGNEYWWVVEELE